MQHIHFNHLQTKLPSLNQCPDQPNAEHSNDHKSQHEDGSDECKNIITVFDEDLCEANWSVLRVVEPSFILQDNESKTLLMDLGDPGHSSSLHDKLLETEEDRIHSSDSEHDATMHIDEGDVLCTDGDFKHEPGKEKGEDGCHSAAEDVNDKTEDSDGFIGNAGVDLGHRRPES